MKNTMITLILILLSVTEFNFEKITPVAKNHSYDHFYGAYQNIRKWEGHYSNSEHDKGGETYCGITRRFNQKWGGWKIIDDFKLQNQVGWNTKIPKVDSYVEQYYRNLWVSEKFYLINEKDVAKYLFDYRNTGPVSIKHLKQILISHGYQVKLNTTMDIKTINAINQMNPDILIKSIKERRIRYYTNVVNKNPELSKFLTGWIRRANFL